MEFIYGLTNLRRQQRACAATVGNFDGVHLGHQAVLEQLKLSVVGTELISTVLIFEPQPIEVFSPKQAPSRLTRLREKLQQFARHDVDRVVCLRFNKSIANLSAVEFVQQILLDALAIKKLIIGDDFHFAKNKEGNYRTLINLGRQLGFDVRMTRTFNADQERVSSTLIRESLARGYMFRASQLLGRPYQISGRVVHGEKRGRRLGFATANLELYRYFSPVYGVFAGRVYGISSQALDAVIYVGSRPVYQGSRVLLEVHLLDFNADLYGKRLQVEFLEKLRDDLDFESEVALVAQIEKDINDARMYLQRDKPESLTTTIKLDNDKL